MKKIFTFCLALVASVGMSYATFTNFEIDLRGQQLGGTSSEGGSKYLVIDGPTYNYEDEEPVSYNAYFTFANFNGTQHGYTNLTAAVPVEAGNYKLTLGACGYGSGAGTVKDATKAETLASFNQQIEPNTKCYHLNEAENIVVATFKVTADQTINITCGNYTPYIKLEKLEAQEFIVTFAAEGAEGTVPASQAVVEGENMTIPANRTLYKEGYTLTGWNDGTATYAPGASYAPTANVTLNAVFTENTANLLTATEVVNVKWDFQTGQGAPTLTLQNNTGFLIAQAVVGTTPLDVKLIIDATNGKCNNASWTDWCQVNTNTQFTVPSKAGIVLRAFTMHDPNGTLDGLAQTSYESNVASYTNAEASGTSLLVNNANTYYRWIEVTYPASSTTSVDNTAVGNKAVKILHEGQLLIERDGKVFNPAGIRVK